jgi:hypothetical protein
MCLPGAGQRPAQQAGRPRGRGMPQSRHAALFISRASITATRRDRSITSPPPISTGSICAGRDFAERKRLLRELLAGAKSGPARWASKHRQQAAGRAVSLPIPKLLEAPFWLDPGDPHRMRSAMQLLTQPPSYNYAVASGDWRPEQSLHGPKRAAIPGLRRSTVAADGISPEQAVEEAIARIKADASIQVSS